MVPISIIAERENDKKVFTSLKEAAKFLERGDKMIKRYAMKNSDINGWKLTIADTNEKEAFITPLKKVIVVKHSLTDALSIHGDKVEIRSSDGYVNATKMCKAGGKGWGQYFQNDTTKTFIEELAIDTGLSIKKLIEVAKGRYGGTWVHPQVATHLGNWLSTGFAVKVTNWVEKAKILSPIIKDEYNNEIANIQPDNNIQYERIVRDALALSLNGIVEVPSKYGPIDIVTEDEVIEIKRVRKYTHALGQVLGHSQAFPGKQPRVHLFGTVDEFTPQLYENAFELFAKFGVKLTYEYIEDTTPKALRVISETELVLINDQDDFETIEEDQEYIEVILAKEHTKQEQEHTMQEQERSRQLELKLEIMNKLENNLELLKLFTLSNQKVF